MTIYAEKKGGKETGRWYVELGIPGTLGKRYRELCANKAAAEKRNAYLKRRGLPKGVDAAAVGKSTVRRPKAVEAGRLTLEDIRDQCLRTQYIGTSEAHRSDQRIYLSRFVEWLRAEGKEPDKLKTADLELWVAHCQESYGRSPSSVNHHLVAARHYLEYLVKAGLMEEVPRCKPASTRHQKMRRPLANEQEAIALATTLRDQGTPAVADILIASIGTGLRQGQLLAAQPEWLKEDEPGRWSLHFPKTKTTGRRTKAITAEMAEHLKRCLPFGELVGGSLCRKRIGAAIRKARAKLGWTAENDLEFTFHGARHTFGTWMTRAGVATRVVQSMMDHASIRSTQIYTHVAGDMHRDVLDTINLGGLLAPAPPQGNADAPDPICSEDGQAER